MTQSPSDDRCGPQTDLGSPPINALVQRARGLLEPGRRAILGIAGPPGAGKSTLAAALRDALGGSACLVPMDGFHLAQDELARLGRAERKGAPDTFDAAGFVHLLRRLRANTDDAVYAPDFDRVLEQPIAGAICVPHDIPLVIVEGNYLLLDMPPWQEIRAVVDEVWYCDLPEDERLRRLVRRHESFDKAPAEAAAWATGPDQANADLVAATRPHADVLITGWT